jgi:hypothetical protein
MNLSLFLICLRTCRTWLRNGNESFTVLGEHWNCPSASGTLSGYWEWVNGRLQMMPNLSTPGIIALTQGQVLNYTIIKRLEVWQAMRTLGVRAAPDGNYRKEAGFLQNKVNTYASQLITSNLTEMDTFIFH